MAEQQAVIDSRWNDLDGWSSSSVEPSKQFNMWRDFVVDAHLFWDIKAPAHDRFPAFLRQGRFDGHRLIHLTAASGGVTGKRSRHEMAKDDEEFYNLLYIAEGKLGLDFGTHNIVLEPGTFAVWDTSRPLEFNVIEKLREISFSVPKKRVESDLLRPEDFCARVIQSKVGIAKLFVDCLQALESNFGELSKSEANDVLNATTEMMVAMLLSKARPQAATAHDRQLRHVTDWVARNIDNPCLAPARIAREVGLSERQLFRLFATVGTTPAVWLRKLRLERCRADLLSPSCAHLSVTDVASRWGFVDSSVFSRGFRQEFGVSPRQIRSALASPIPTADEAPGG
jgi:AraC-like DNA-binding protein